MKRQLSISLFILISLLSIGFASVTTNVTLANETSISMNSQNFNVYFLDASTDESGSALISDDKKSITFNSKNLIVRGSTALLRYKVKNDSSQYDANVNINYHIKGTNDGTDYSEYYTITQQGFKAGESSIIPGKQEKDGELIITLDKLMLDGVQVYITVDIDVTAIERTEEASVIVDPACDYLHDTCDINTIGNEIKIGDEHFYAIGNNRLLSKYNLNVGNNIQEGKEGIQNSKAIGYNFDATTMDSKNNYPATIAFSITNYWYKYKKFGVNIKPEYGLLYPADVYDSNSKLYSIVNSYSSYIASLGVNNTGTILTRNDLVSLGCDATIADRTCTTSSYPFLYSTTYWVGTASEGKEVYYVQSDGKFMATGIYDSSSQRGVRPVIVIK